MKFEEPKVEFVPVDVLNTSSSTCEPGTEKSGSVETCTGTDAPSNNCCDGTNAFAF